MSPRRLMFACLLVLTAAEALVAEDQRLTVTLSSGREFTALVDSRTDDAQLWLRFPTEGGGILRPVEWKRVQGARLGAENIAVADLRQVAEKLKSAPADSPASNSQLTVPPTDNSSVAYIQTRAWVANWDADAEPDGICLEIRLFNDRDQIVSASGNAQVELFAARERKYHEVPQSGGWRTELMERWGAEFGPTKSSQQDSVVRLPFGAIHPDSTKTLDRHGLLQVRVVIPGSGVFEDVLDGVLLRDWSPVRQYRR